MIKPHYSEELLEKAARIKLLICDVDGVLSNGQVIIGNHGEELKTFNIKDGFGLKSLMKHGVEVAIITGRNSEIVAKRCQELSIQHYYQGQQNKIAAYTELCEKLSIQPFEVCHVGDDLPDLPLMRRSGLGVTVSDGHWFVREHADWVTDSKGGHGAVREITDMILQSQSGLESLHREYY
ncbi:3-deoxy-manno-octulosonate-8-phosphatase KdsC [Kangiella sediminilitoris]|uniref:3-deoxy-D-manno-octulosonate 8-phosphate phosphatase KdsC n=1 Tax=Kangiella sediminilitoris TaxID=1144748 RepID=A0A1B3BCG0_9GAMM|nr:3-deoxy-manno-octulosonate-8-phosphatase KdsC [Kangiella sediminilitoris]AOE50501.1 3-deoxy-D-manno-octulosonate 8-phosphate phosphatase, YrbI family [Kangiella sediminilitoris]